MEQQLQQETTKQGPCDLCGLWDGNLIEGLCASCNEIFPAETTEKVSRETTKE